MGRPLSGWVWIMPCRFTMPSIATENVGKHIGVIVDFNDIPIGKLQPHGHHVVTTKIGIQLPII